MSTSSSSPNAMLRRSTRLITATTTHSHPSLPPGQHVRTISMSTAIADDVGGSGTSRAVKKAKVEAEDEVDEVKALSRTGTVKSRRKTGVETAAGANDEDASKTTRKRKQKSTIPEPSLSSFPLRSPSLWKLGAHVSAAGGVENAVTNAASIGANAFALFVKSQRKWTGPALTDESIAKFKSRLETLQYSPKHILPHGSYLINLGNPDEEKRQKSYDCFLDDLKRCEQLGLQLYNFHPGSTLGLVPTSTSLALIADCINRAHGATSSIIAVIESMAGAGNVVGGAFADIGGIIERVEDKSRVGVCLDTCHMFAAGYDIRTQEGWRKMLDEFDREIGLQYLRGMHLNDSKCDLSSKKDRHENIGLGFLGLTSFHHILTDPRVQDIPLILETPQHDDEHVWAKELEVLNRLSGLKLEEEGGAEAVLANWTAEIGEVVKGAGSGSGKKASGKRKRKLRGEPDEDVDEEEDDGE